MKTVLVAVLFGCMFGLPASELPASLPASAKTIKVKILNGKTGLPVWWLASPFVYVGSSTAQVAKRGNLLGEATIDVSQADSPVVRVWVDYIDRDCRVTPGANEPRVEEIQYSIPEIETKGIVSPNLCGTKRRKPAPGILSIYVIPATFKELWDS
jgi:hypothetical protein